jgi:hypothetical protein
LVWAKPTTDAAKRPRGAPGRAGRTQPRVTITGGIPLHPPWQTSGARKSCSADPDGGPVDDSDPGFRARTTRDRRRSGPPTTVSASKDRPRDGSRVRWISNAARLTGGPRCVRSPVTRTAIGPRIGLAPAEPNLIEGPAHSLDDRGVVTAGAQGGQSVAPPCKNDAKRDSALTGGGTSADV